MNKTATILSALALTLGGPPLQAVAKPPQGMPEAVINWSMAERTVRIENLDFKGELDNGNYHWMIKGPGGVPGLYAGVSSVPLDQINPPQGYQVTLDGCSSTGNITQYEWKINGSRVSKSKDCRFTTSLPEGSYQVQLTVNGGGRKNTATEVAWSDPPQKCFSRARRIILCSFPHNDGPNLTLFSCAVATSS